MVANPWDKFFWNDWENDPGLKLCSLAAQGLWMRMLCICAKAEPKGYLLVAGRPLSPADVASLVGKTEAEVEALMSELSLAGVFSRDRKQRIYNRRMVKATQKSAIARENGKKGGNPNLSKTKRNPDWDNPPDNPKDKPHKPRAKSQNIDPKGSRDLILEAFEQFNEQALSLGLPTAQKLTSERKRKLAARLRDHGQDGWVSALQEIERSAFLRGDSQSGWRADLDFLLQPSKLTKVIEGAYRDAPNGAGAHLRPGTEAFERAKREAKRTENWTEYYRLKAMEAPVQTA